MCCDLTIVTDGNLVYHLTHDVCGCLHLTADVGNTTDHHLVDQHIDGFRFPHIGMPMSIIATPPLWTPLVRSVRHTEATAGIVRPC